MLKNSKAFSSFSVDNIEKAKEFYGEVLGLDVKKQEEMGETLLNVETGSGSTLLVYLKENHQPATFTILNFPVDDIDEAVDTLTARGARFEHYDQENLKTDEKGIMRSEKMSIAWFTDPAGNILSLIAGG